jgi:general secretion pathway protein D
VLGGLISDNVTKSEQRVPFLGSLPLIGLAFKTRDYTRTRNNLMVFIHPKVLRTREQSAIETGAKYNYMLDEQHRADKRDSTPLLPGEKTPTLPPLRENP